MSQITVRVVRVDLLYRATGSSEYTLRQMNSSSGDRYIVTLEGSLVQTPGFEYYIEATDGVSITRHGRADSPHQVTITDAPVVNSVTPAKGPSGGGTAVVIMGSNFKPGASVQFGQTVATSVVV